LAGTTVIVSLRLVTTDDVLAGLRVPVPRLDHASIRRLTAQPPAASSPSVKERLDDIVTALPRAAP
jgi:hypothetical protein